MICLCLNHTQKTGCKGKVNSPIMTCTNVSIDYSGVNWFAIMSHAHFAYCSYISAGQCLIGGGVDRSAALSYVFPFWSLC